MSEYTTVSKGSLKLKGITMKKKKKKLKEEKLQETIKSIESSATEQQNVNLKEEIPLTKAQLSFLKMQEKRKNQRVMEKASKTHKQRVEEFNRKLDQMTEHYDIPKVSWTK